MPIYEYRCDRCGVFEVTQRITEPALEKCPTCRKKVSRLISSTSFQLKGSGWYVTDYARKGSGAGSKDATAGSKDAAAGGNGGSEASGTSDGGKDAKSSPAESKASSKESTASSKSTASKDT